MDNKHLREDNSDRNSNQNLRGNDEVPDSLNYPPEEDITRQAKREDIDVERITRGGNVDETRDNHVSADLQMSSFQHDDIENRTDADVTREEVDALDATDGMIRTSRLDQTDETDLDIPGSELDDDNEAIGEEDEENNYYSLGGDRHED